jgi:3-dehydroquinate dehydratase / shikimate dehydrogenase
MQRLCVTVTAPTMAELVRRRDEATAAGADLVELRLDTARDPDVGAALADRRCPVVITCRPAWEGGTFNGSEEERHRLLAAALAAGADYVDVEAAASFADLLTGNDRRRIVLSSHAFDGVPADLEARIRSMKATGAAIAKVAVATSRLADCVTLLDLSRKMDGDGVILIGMGEHGAITRVLPSLFGSSWGYAGTLAGVGQITPGGLSGEFRFREIAPNTDLYGIIGRPIAHSVSPAMHNAAFRDTGINAVYLPLPAVDVDDFVAFARAFGLRGASVTIPFKVAMFDRVDEPSSLARKVGAINAVRMDGSRWLGDNTDVHGFLEPLDGGRELTGIRASILGAGGAARGVAIALASSGARVSVHGRRPARAGEVAALVGGAVGSWPPEPGSWDLLVNCTSVGMHPNVDDSPLDRSRLEPAAGRTAAAAPGTAAPRTVYDIVYNPQTTRLMREAAGAGCRTIGGLEMLVGQARQAFEWWAGVRPSAEVMRNAAIRKLSEFERP